MIIFKIKYKNIKYFLINLILFIKIKYSISIFIDFILIIEYYPIH